MPPKDPILKLDAEDAAVRVERRRKSQKVDIPREVNERYSLDDVEGMILKVESDKADALLAITKYDERLIELNALLEKVNNKL